MKQLLHYTALCLCSFLISNSIFSQSLGIDSNATNLSSLPDTITLNDNYTHTITIQNKSAIPFTGTIWLMAGVDTINTGTVVGIDSVGFANVVNFGLNDTVSITYNENYDLPNDYKLGDNIVVVWPIAANCSSCSTSDSLFQNVHILNPVSIDDIQQNNKLIVYPSPAKDFLQFKTDNSSLPKSINIYDLTGKLVLNKPFTPILNIAELKQGVYLVRVVYKEEELHFKLIKE